VTGPFIGGFREASAYLGGISRRTLGRHLPEIEHVRIGSRVLFTRAALDAFAARYRVPARPARRAANVERIVRAVGRGRVR
jgi:hypothetical protein